jgi:hypothetical protein
MAQSVWKSGNAAGSSWTIKGVQEATREAVREAAAQAELLIGDWVDQALRGAALAAMHPAPPPATRSDVAAVLGEVAELKATVKELAGARATPKDPAESRAILKELAELRATVQALVQQLERQERHERQERPVVRHVLVEQRKSVRVPPRRGGDRDDRGP